MPLKRLLDESRAFDPKAVAILLEAFNAVVAELDLRTGTDKERAAKIIIRIALSQRNLDVATIRDGDHCSPKGKQGAPPAILTDRRLLAFSSPLRQPQDHVAVGLAWPTPYVETIKRVPIKRDEIVLAVRTAINHGALRERREDDSEGCGGD